MTEQKKVSSWCCSQGLPVTDVEERLSHADVGPYCLLDHYPSLLKTRLPVLFAGDKRLERKKKNLLLVLLVLHLLLFILHSSSLLSFFLCRSSGGCFFPTAFYGAPPPTPTLLEFLGIWRKMDIFNWLVGFISIFFCVQNRSISMVFPTQWMCVQSSRCSFHRVVLTLLSVGLIFASQLIQHRELWLMLN